MKPAVFLQSRGPDPAAAADAAAASRTQEIRSGRKHQLSFMIQKKKVIENIIESHRKPATYSWNRDGTNKDKVSSNAEFSHSINLQLI